MFDYPIQSNPNEDIQSCKVRIEGHPIQDKKPVRCVELSKALETMLVQPEQKCCQD